MLKKIILQILFVIIYSFGTEFNFSNDTIWESNDSGFPVETFLINRTNDSLYIDSLALIIDTITFQEYEIRWKAEKGIYMEWYHFGNRENGYPPITSYQKANWLMRTDSLDSLKLLYMSIDKILYFKFLSEKYDSIVPITVGIIFFSEGYKDTLIVKGLYDSTTQTSIMKQNIPIKIIKKYDLQNHFLYDCLGRRIPLVKILKRNERIAKGVYVFPEKKHINILQTPMR